MRGYLRLVDQPVQVGSGTISRVAREPFRLDIEALLGALDHGLGCTDFGLADGARCLDIHDDAELHVNKIIVRIGKERWSAHGPRPLRRGIGWRDKLRRHVAGGRERRVIEPGEILLGRTAYRLRIQLLAPPFAGNRSLLVSIGDNQAGIHRKAFAADQASPDAGAHNSLKHVAEDATIVEPLIADPRKRRVIQDLVFNREPTKPSIGKVHLYIATLATVGGGDHEL